MVAMVCDLCGDNHRPAVPASAHRSNTAQSVAPSIVILTNIQLRAISHAPTRRWTLNDDAREICQRTGSLSGGVRAGVASLSDENRCDRSEHVSLLRLDWGNTPNSSSHRATLQPLLRPVASANIPQLAQQPSSSSQLVSETAPFSRFPAFQKAM